MPYVHLNGRLVDEDDARVPVFDGGLQHAIGLFETMRSYAGRVFRLEDHLDRLLASAQELDLPLNVTRAGLATAVIETVEANGFADARVRLTVTRGRLGTGDAPPAPTVFAVAGPMTPHPAELYENGMAVTIADVRQNETDPLSRHKTLQYFSRFRALEAARRAGAGETLFFNTARRLACGAISNVFLVKDDELITPPREAGILPGITRKAVLELAAAEGWKIAERDAVIADVLAAQEVFLTNSIMEVMPVVQIEKHRVGEGKPGAKTRRLRELLITARGHPGD